MDAAARRILVPGGKLVGKAHPDGIEFAMPEGSENFAAGAPTGKTPGRLSPRQRSNANLRPPWPKGVSGNPSGRPRHKRGVWIKVTSVDDLMAAMLAVIEAGD